MTESRSPQQVGCFLQHLVRGTEGLSVYLVAALCGDQLRELGSDVDVRAFEGTTLDRAGTAGQRC